MPSATYLSSSNWRCERISRSSSASARLERTDDSRRRIVRRMNSVLEEELVDEPCEPAPALRLLPQGALTRSRQRVELGLAVRFGPAPGGLDPALLLHADERRIERALVERQRMIRHLRQPGRERVGMQRSHRGQGAQNDEVERPLQQLDVLVSTRHASGEWQALTRMSSGEPRELTLPLWRFGRMSAPQAG